MHIFYNQSTPATAATTEEQQQQGLSRGVGGNIFDQSENVALYLFVIVAVVGHTQRVEMNFDSGDWATTTAVKAAAATQQQLIGFV